MWPDLRTCRLSSLMDASSHCAEVFFRVPAQRKGRSDQHKEATELDLLTV